MTDFRCAAQSARDDEPMAGTAPTEQSWLFLEYAGAWGRQAVAESRLPAEVRDYLGGLSDQRVQLIRRYAGAGRPGVRLFRAQLAGPPQVQTLVLGNVRELLDLLPSPTTAPWTEHREPLLLVCTNGSRDRCCTEFGRPVAARLAQRWPAETWETTHLGGHRFSATMFVLPAGITLGRLDPDSAMEAVADVLAGRLPLEVMRGLAGRSARAQVAELRLRSHLGLREVDAVQLVAEQGDRITLAAPNSRWLVEVAGLPGPARRQSCGNAVAKPTIRFTVTALRPL